MTNLRVAMVLEIATTMGALTCAYACGLIGGGDGAPHRYWLQSSSRPDRPLRTKETGIVVAPGDVLHVRSCGGGGWGPPCERSLEARRLDAELGFVSR